MLSELNKRYGTATKVSTESHTAAPKGRVVPVFSNEDSELEFVEDTSPNEWIDSPDTSLAEIHEAGTLADNLEILAADTEVAPAVAVESFHRVFKAMVGEDLAPQKMISVEEFKGRNMSGRILARSIRSHVNTLRTAIVAALEDYSAEGGSKFGTMVENYRRSLSQLDGVEDEVHVADKIVKIDHTNIWKMFHKNGKFIKPDEITTEIQEIHKLLSELKSYAGQLSSVAARPEGDVGSLPNFSGKFMFNRTITIDNGQVRVSDADVPKPSKEYSGSDYAWIAGWSIFFGPLGLIGSLIFKKKTGSEAERNRGTQEMHAFINNVKKLNSEVSQLETMVAQVSKAMRTSKNASVKSGAAPFFELANVTMKQISELTYGAAQLFTKVKNAG